MVTSFDDFAVFKNHDCVTVSYRTQAVSNYKYCTTFHQSVHTFFDEPLSTCIDTACSFVQNQYRRIGNSCTCNGNQLTLSLRQVFTVTGDDCVVSLRQVTDELVRIGGLSSLDTIFVRCVQFAVTDVVHYSTRKQVCVLQNHTKRSSEVSLLDLVDVDAVVSDLTVGNIVESVDEVGNCCLTCTCRTYESNLLSRFGVQRNSVQNSLVFFVTEHYVFKSYVTTQWNVGYSSVTVRMFPSPLACTCFAFGNVTLFVNKGIYKSNITFVHFGRFVKHFEHTLCTCHSHEDDVHLLRKLADGVYKATNIQQECCDYTNGNYFRPLQRNQRAENCNQCVEQVSKVTHDGWNHACVSVSLFSNLLQICVDYAVTFDCLVFVVEHLDDLLAFDVLFNVTIELTYRNLLSDKALLRTATDDLQCKEDTQQQYNDYQRQRKVQHAHHCENSHNSQCT